MKSVGIVLLAVIVVTSCVDKTSVLTTAPNQVNVVRNDTVLTFGVWSKAKEAPVTLDKRYFYYVRNTVANAQGSYLGKPLDGSFVMTTRTNVPLKKGVFSGGVQNGTWIKWYANGNIEEVVRWKKGQRSGKFRTYFEDGSIRSEGAYKNDLLSGKVTFYNERGNKNSLQYEEGILKEVKTKEKRDTTLVKSPRKLFKRKKEKADNPADVKKETEKAEKKEAEKKEREKKEAEKKEAEKKRREEDEKKNETTPARKRSLFKKDRPEPVNQKQN